MEENTPKCSPSSAGGVPRSRNPDETDDYIPQLCRTTEFAEEILRTSLQRERAATRVFRERYIANTLIGRFLLDLYFRFEDKLIRRGRSSQLSCDDRTFINEQVDQFRELGLELAADPHASTIHLTSEHIEMARQCYQRAIPFLHEDEQKVATELFAMAEGRIGSTPTNALALLNDTELFEKTKKLAYSIEFLR